MISNTDFEKCLEQHTATPHDFTETMENLEEAKNYIRVLYAQLMEEKEAYRRIQDTIDEIKEELKETRKLTKAQSEQNSKLLETIAARAKELKDANTKLLELTQTSEKLRERLNIANKEHHGASKSQKGIKFKTQPK